MSEEKVTWCVVTGGRGFVARHLVQMLIEAKWYVRIADLSPSIKLDPYEEEGTLGNALRCGQAVYVSADLREKDQVHKAFQGAEVVFHMAAPDSSINNYQLQYSVNVEGTKNVIESCMECNVKRLIYTSSPSVVFDGIHGIDYGIESMPYPQKHNDFYSATKAEGESLVLKANGKNGLLTCSIRPSSIFGPGDKLMVPSVVAAARAGKSRFIIGDGNNMYDFTYVENVAHGHVCAERALASGDTVGVAGQAYFITNAESIKFWEFMGLILEGLGYARPKTKIPASFVMPIAHVVEWTYKMLSPYGMQVPQLTPSRVRLLSCNRTFSCSKAKEKLGYAPIVSLKEGIKRTVESYSHLRAEVYMKSKGDAIRQSKASIFLGNGKVADTLLWKDTKKTLAVLFVLMTVYYYFFAPGYTFIATISKLLLTTTILLFIHSLLPAKALGCKFEKIPGSCFNMSEEMTQKIAKSTIAAWNSVIAVFESLCLGNNWILFAKVVASLLILSFFGTLAWQTIFFTGLLFIFVGFYVYDKKEDEIDELIHKAMTSASRLKLNITEKLQLNFKH